MSFTTTYYKAMEVDDAESWGAAFTDYGKYGITASLTSGAVGLYNTATSIGNMFGAENEEVKTADVLDKLGMQATAKYARENETLVEFGGLVAGSLIPGYLGVKALHMAQKGLAGATSAGRGVTAIRAALVPKNQLTAMLDDMTKKGTYATANSQLAMKAAKEGVHQALLESSFAETAILLTMNQHSMLNDQDLGYIDSLKYNFDSLVFGVALGGAIGGAAMTMGIKSQMQKAIKDRFKDVRSIADPNAGNTGLFANPGDLLADTVFERDKLVRELATNPGDAFKRQELIKSRELLDTRVGELVRQTIKDSTWAGSPEYAGHISKTFTELALNLDAQTAVNNFAGLQRIKSVKEEYTLFQPRMESYGVYDSLEGVKGLVQNVTGKQRTPEEVDKAALQLWEQTYGFAYPDAKNVEVRAAVLNGNVPGVTREQQLATMRHEVGHLTGRKLAKVLDTKFGKHIRRQMVEVSRTARAADWATADAYALRIKQMEEAVAKPDFSMTLDEMDAWAQQRKSMEQHINYMNDADELLADTLGQFTSDAYEKFAQKFPDLDSMLRGNNALSTRMRQADVIMDLQTGALTKQVDRIPTIADMGRWRLSGSKVILDVGKNDTRIYDVADGVLNPMTDTPEMASAKYLWAKQNPFTSKDTQVNLGLDDLAGFNRVLDGHINHGFTGKVVVENMDKATGLRTGTRTFDFGMDPERAQKLFRNFVIERKADLSDKISKAVTKGGKGKPEAFSWDDKARILDVDKKFAFEGVLFAQRGDEMSDAGLAFWSEKYDPRFPTQAKMTYDRDLKAPTTETEVRTHVEANKRIDLVRESAVQQIAGYIGVAYNPLKLNLPDPTVVSSNNRFTQVTQSDPTQGFVRSSNAEYTDPQEFANAVGREKGRMDAYSDKRISELVEPAIHSVVRHPEAMAEMTTTISKFRQYKMEEIPPEWKMGNMDGSGGPVRNWFSGIARANLKDGDAVAADVFKRKMELMEPTLAKLTTLASGKDPLKFASYDVLKGLEDLALAERVDRDAIQRIFDMLDNHTGSITQPAVANLWRALREANQTTVKGAKLSASLRGKSASWNANQFYPGALDRQLYKEIVFVKPKVTGLMGDKEFGIIGGPDDKVVQDKLAMLRAKHGDNFEVITQKSNDVRHKELLQDYEDGLTIDSFYFDSSKLNMGKAADLMPDPNPQLLWSMLDSYKRQARGVNSNLIKQYYDEEFQYLDSLETMRERAAGTFGTKDTTASVYQDLKATMLNMPNDNRFKLWREGQRGADRLFSAVWNTVVTLPLRMGAPSGLQRFLGMDEVTTIKYQEMNALAKKYGLPQMYTEDLTQELISSMKVNDQLLASLVPRMNWLGATFTLRLDGIQPLINAISLPILSVPEIGHLVDALPELRKAALKDSLHVKAVDKTGKVLAKEPTNSKLLYQAAVNWFKRKDLRERYTSLGIIGQRAELYMNAVESAAQVSRKLVDNPDDALAATKQALTTGVEFLSKFGDGTEDFVRFAAADMARQVLEAGGVTGKVADMAINTYVNRVTGNYQYAQRPAMFQGFAGQAIGLFQTYQFNLIQQMLRHLGEKPSRAAAMMGLQTGIFGLQSVPGFEALNNHIAERSKYEGDFYTRAKAAIGQTDVLGAPTDEWLLYGLASNFTRPLVGDGIDLFSRGNLNPRSAIIIPSTWEDVPVISMTTKFASSMMQAADNLAGGVPVSDTFYQALATNGINRPLQGIGQLMAGERITSQGSFLLSTEDLDWWQKGARIFGAKGMDESIAVAHYYRAVKYEAARQDQLESLGRVVKAQVQAGNWDGEAYTSMMEEYASQGGEVQRFDKWTQNLYKSATQSQIGQMYERHDSVEGRYMQQVMGAGVQQYINPWNVPDQQ